MSRSNFRSQLGFARCMSMLAVVISLAACGGGGGGGSGTLPPVNQPSGPTWTAGLFQPSSTFKNQCASPRTGNDTSGQPFPDRAGSTVLENHWLRSWTNELYLWYSEVADRNPASYATPAYFDLLKTTATTATGRSKDQFHFTYDTAEYIALSQSGVSSGYGAQFALISRTPPREAVVTLVEANTPAASAGLRRGDRITVVDGESLVSGSNATTLNNGLFPTANGQTHSFTLTRAGTPYQVQMVSALITSAPVHTTTVLNPNTDRVGYILFNDHIATSEAGLINAITTLRNASVQGLILDIRYNGGGFLDIASELAYMIAGNARTSGQNFERIAFNDKHTATNPVTGRPLAGTPFHTTSQGFSTGVPAGTALPTLNLNTVYVITTAETCSASEAIMNGLRGVGVSVVQIGTTTCGKPYGFYRFDNCGTSYFSIQFKGVNAANFGDYADGFSPVNTSLQNRGEPVPGCSVADDFDHELGDLNERMVQAAMGYRANGSCPAATLQLGQQKTRAQSATADPAQMISKPAWRENRILSRESF